MSRRVRCAGVESCAWGLRGRGGGGGGVLADGVGMKRGSCHCLRQGDQ